MNSRRLHYSITWSARASTKVEMQFGSPRESGTKLKHVKLGWLKRAVN